MSNQVIQARFRAKKEGYTVKLYKRDGNETGVSGVVNGRIRNVKYKADIDTMFNQMTRDSNLELIEVTESYI